MDVIQLLQQVASAVEDAKTKEAIALKASAHLEEVKADAKAKYDASVGEAQAAYDEALAAHQDAKVAGQRLKDQANAALGGVFTADPRVRIG